MKSVTPILVICLMLGCGSGSGDAGRDARAVNRDTLTQRQRDSILAQSKIPGASGVGRAMTAADAASARTARADSLARDTTPQ